jgi:virulence-associated protein VagC
MVRKAGGGAKTKRLARSARALRRAKLFWTGRSQAVRLPKEFRFSATEVAIRREGERVVLEPVEIERDAQGWPLAFWQLAGAEPLFDTGERPKRHERGDVLARRR